MLSKETQCERETRGSGCGRPESAVVLYLKLILNPLARAKASTLYESVMFQLVLMTCEEGSCPQLRPCLMSLKLDRQMKIEAHNLLWQVARHCAPSSSNRAKASGREV